MSLFNLEITTKSKLADLAGLHGPQIYVAFLPGDSYKTVVERVDHVISLGYEAVVHFPARSIQGFTELHSFISAVLSCGVRTALVIRGSRDRPVGDYHSAKDILKTGLFCRFDSIGIAGHPEGITGVPDAALQKSIEDKVELGVDHIITQWCVDTEAINRFISKQSVPVHVGITAPLTISSILKFARIIGVKQSMSKLSSLMKHKSAPQSIIDGVEAPIFHVYGFGVLKESVAWLNIQMEGKNGVSFTS